MDAGLERRFWAKVIPEPNTGCWLWMGAATRQGYGVIGKGGRADGVGYAHRLSWELAKGSIPDGLWVLHRCDHPPCVNPAHLFLGTRADNMQDCARKGRHGAQVHREDRPRGENHPNARLNDAVVRSIRRLRAKGLSYREIAGRHQLPKSLISDVVTRKTWGHVR